MQLPTDSFKRTNNLLATISSTKDDIAKTIKSLNPNKKISIRMLKICSASVLKTLELTIKSCIASGKFPIEWKKANVVSIHKKITNS